MTIISLHNYKVAYLRQQKIFYHVAGFLKSVNDFCSVWPQSAGTTSAMETGLGLSDVQLESADLWIPGFDGQEYNHKQWLTTLACTLIESGFVQDEILLILSPMCKTKVTINSITLFIYRPLARMNQFSSSGNFVVR